MIPNVSGFFKFVDCPVNYSPCNCTTRLDGTGKPDISEFQVVCDQIPISEVKIAFSQTPDIDLAGLTLTLAPAEASPIQADLLANSSAKNLYITCKEGNQLVIDENAFRSSKSKSESLDINGCDFTKQPNFVFLRDFQVFSQLQIDGSTNLQSFQELPSTLKSLIIGNSRGFESLVDGPNIALPNLEELNLIENNMGDVLAAKILKTLASSSTESLNILNMLDNNLTRIPEMVTSFNKLTQLWLEQNAITTIDTPPFSSSGLIKRLYFRGNAISSIKPNIFGGIIYNVLNCDSLENL